MFVTADGSLTDASGVQLSSLDDITGAIPVPSHVGEFEQIEEPITSPDTLKWIEISRDVAESIRAKEKVWRVPLCTNRGRDWEALRLRLSNIFIRNSFRAYSRGSSATLLWSLASSVPGLGRTGRLGEFWA